MVVDFSPFDWNGEKIFFVWYCLVWFTVEKVLLWVVLVLVKVLLFYQGLLLYNGTV
jgi:hypothetical protein